MMRKVALLSFAAVAAGLFAGCVGSQPFECPKTPIYSHFTAPVSIGYDKTPQGSKVGRSESKAYLSLISTGDASVEKAARSAGINTINYVEYEYENVLFIIQTTTVIVHGD